jgi:preprotein translocase subunit SecE
MAADDLPGGFPGRATRAAASADRMGRWPSSVRHRAPQIEKAMSTNTQVETVSTGADKAKLAGAAVLLVGAVVVFYLLSKQDLWLRTLALVALLAAAVALYFTSESGRQLIAFGRDAVRETKKVVWPTRKEAMQMTGYVFAFVFVMALFLWLTDKTLEWVLYDLVLGWKR